jgi:hypothetical protein
LSKDANLVDYLILSPNVFDVVSEFEVIDFNPDVLGCAKSFALLI